MHIVALGEHLCLTLIQVDKMVRRHFFNLVLDVTQCM